MASDETLFTFHSCSLQDEEDLDDAFDIHNHLHPHPHNVSRLSVCTIESFDADGEQSDGKELAARLSSDSENEFGSCYSLPCTPPRRRSQVKEYASDNGGEGGKKKGGPAPRRRRRSLRSDRWRLELERAEKEHGLGLGVGLSGESDHSGVMLITRPKGGKRALCMDLDEVKACRDLGFELEHERLLDTSSGGNSPIANWRISSPGDDPRDVKARLKVWAQAVALVSTTKYAT